jgi:hypothetical protein
MIYMCTLTVILTDQEEEEESQIFVRQDAKRTHKQGRKYTQTQHHTPASTTKKDEKTRNAS